MDAEHPPPPPRRRVPPGLRDATRAAAQRALDEDLDTHGDLTSAAVVPADVVLRAEVVAARGGVLAGTAAFEAVVDLVDPRVSAGFALGDGTRVEAGEAVGELAGPLRSMLTAREAALGLLGHLSGIATRTRALADAVEDSGCVVCPARPSTPGLRLLEHAAVIAGGGAAALRTGLHDGLLVTAEHATGAGSLTAATRQAIAAAHVWAVQVVVHTEAEVDQALTGGARQLRLEGYDPAVLAPLVARIRAAEAELGGLGIEVALPAAIPAEVARQLAELGVDRLAASLLGPPLPLVLRPVVADDVEG